jgi:hypothetical protein
VERTLAPDGASALSRPNRRRVALRPGGSIPNWSWHRRLLSQAGNVYAAILLRLHVAATSGFRAYRAEALRRIDLESARAEEYGFQIEMVHQIKKHGGQVTEVPIRFVVVVAGKSKMSMHMVVDAPRDQAGVHGGWEGPGAGRCTTCLDVAAVRPCGATQPAPIDPRGELD